MNYVKIPKEIIYQKDMLDKRVLIFSYLCARRSLDDTVGYSIAELCRWSDVKPNRNKGKINEKFLKTLHNLYKKKYFVGEYNFIAIPLSDQYTYHLLQLNIEKFDVAKDYGNIYFDELDKIIHFKKELKNSGITLDRMSAAYILLFLSYIRLNIYRGNDKPKCCYRYYQSISEDIGLSERYISRIVEILDLLKIIKTQECKRIRYQKNDNEFGFCTNVKVFADYKHYKKDENGKQIIDPDYDSDEEIRKQIIILENK